LHCDKQPKWWKDEEGWLAASTVVQTEMAMPGVLLAAFSEYCK
jgi:hypothetical protein